MKFTLTPIAIALLISQNVYSAEEDNIERIAVEGKYLSFSEANAVKTPTPIIDVPQSLSIITADEITERGITSISQIIDYTPGLNMSQGEGHRDSVVFRGVRSTADFYLDGNRDDVQYYRSLYNIEQVEVLRGANALLFGRGGTGGVINRVTKKAQLDQDFVEYQASINSFGGFGVQVDKNLVSSQDSALRFNAMYEQLDNHRDFYDGERIGFNPTARIELSDATTLDLSYEYSDHERFIDRGIPTGNDGKPVVALDDVTFADAENNFHTLEAHVFRALVSHEFADNVKGNFSAFYGDYDKVYSNFYAASYDQDSNVATLDGYIDTTQRDNLILAGNLIGEFTTGQFEHTILVGAEIIQTNSDQDRINPVFSTTGNDKEAFNAERPLQFSNLSGVNAQGLPFTVAFTNPNDDTHVKLDVTSVYVQDEIALSENFDLVLGARFDSFDIEVLNVLNGETRERKDNEISPRAGFIYKPQENVSMYASYSESFLPRSGEQYANINGDNNQLDPDTFKNRELGVKWDINSELSFTAALFETEQSSPQVADNDPSTLDVIDSEINGFEMQFSGYVSEDIRLVVNYSNLDGEIIERTGPTGRTPRELPENTFSVWSTYQVNDRFGLGLGATYQSESFVNNGNSATLPSYTRIDASAYYQVSEDLRVQLNVENLTDKDYYPSAHSTHQITVGAPVNASLRIIGSF